MGHTLTRLPTKFNLAFFYVIVEMFCISIAAPSALLIYSYEIFSMITSNTSVVLLCIQLAFRCSYQNLFTSHSVSELSTSYTQRMCYWLSFYSLSAIFVEISCPPIHLSTLCLWHVSYTKDSPSVNNMRVVFYNGSTRAGLY